MNDNRKEIKFRALFECSNTLYHHWQDGGYILKRETVPYTSQGFTSKGRESAPRGIQMTSDLLATFTLKRSSEPRDAPKSLKDQIE